MNKDQKIRQNLWLPKKKIKISKKIENKKN